jgi:hypothetical protein
MGEMTTKDNGGPAFPVPMFSIGHAKYQSEQQGMTLHDWYAGMAMQGIIACPTTEGDHDALAKWSHEMADAMMAARKK